MAMVPKCNGQSDQPPLHKLTYLHYSTYELMVIFYWKFLIKARCVVLSL